MKLPLDDSYEQYRYWVARILAHHFLCPLVLRILLECECARLAAMRAKEKDLFRVHLSIQGIRRMFNEGLERFTEFDSNFHEAVIEASGNMIYKTILASLRQRTDAYLSKGKVSRDFCKNTIEDHQTIYESIISHQPETAAQAMRSHLMMSKTFFIGRVSSLEVTKSVSAE